MLKMTKSKTIILSVYAVMTIAFFVLFLFTDTIGSPYHILFIVANFALAVFFIGRYHPLLLAMAATVVADYLLANSEAVSGVTFFILAQLFYFLTQNDGKIGRPQFFILCIWLVVGTAAAIVLSEILDLDKVLLFAVSLYGVISVINNVFPRKNFLSLGIFLLFICDFFIMLSQFDLAGGFNYAWLFYIPSQFFVVIHAALLPSQKDSTKTR